MKNIYRKNANQKTLYVLYSYVVLFMLLLIVFNFCNSPELVNLVFAVSTIVAIDVYVVFKLSKSFSNRLSSATRLFKRVNYAFLKKDLDVLFSFLCKNKRNGVYLDLSLKKNTRSSKTNDINYSLNKQPNLYLRHFNFSFLSAEIIQKSLSCYTWARYYAKTYKPPRPLLQI